MNAGYDMARRSVKPGEQYRQGSDDPEDLPACPAGEPPAVEAHWRALVATCDEMKARDVPRWISQDGASARRASLTDAASRPHRHPAITFDQLANLHRPGGAGPAYTVAGSRRPISDLAMKWTIG